MEKSNAIQILQSRTLITEPGKYQLKVTSVTPFDDKHIINYSGMTNYHLSEAKRLLAEGQFQEATNQSISSSARNGVDYRPAKGEIVEVVLNEVTTKNGITGLFPVSVTALKLSKGNSISLEVEEAVTAEAELV